MVQLRSGLSTVGTLWVQCGYSVGTRCHTMYCIKTRHPAFTGAVLFRDVHDIAGHGWPGGMDTRIMPQQLVDKQSLAQPYVTLGLWGREVVRLDNRLRHFPIFTAS